VGVRIKTIAGDVSMIVALGIGRRRMPGCRSFEN
jgi:hypothetical protein